MLLMIQSVAASAQLEKLTTLLEPKVDKYYLKQVITDHTSASRFEFDDQLTEFIVEQDSGEANFDCRLLPWIRFHALPLPEGFEITGYARIYYPDSYKQNLPVHSDYPDETIVDYLITLTDGKRFHYVGISAAASYEDSRTGVPYRISINYQEKGATAQVMGTPFALYSESYFLAYQEQAELLKALILPLR